MKKQYEEPKVERLNFNYEEQVTASNNSGGIYQRYTDQYYGCHETPTDDWINPF